MGDPYAVPMVRPPSPLGLAQQLRGEVAAWRRDAAYPGATETSRHLLRHWFLDEHQGPDGEPFAFYFCQREAIETLVYLHEVRGVRSGADLVARWGTQSAVPLDLPYARYVVKMATGAGKTKVMALALAWAYFSALREEGSGLPATFLMVAPNLIVLERLRADFDARRIFATDPVIPPEWRADFDLQVVIRNEPVPLSAPGVLCLTNVHVLHERPPPVDTNPVSRLLGPRPPRSETAPPRLVERLAERGRLLVVNDEAHHLHDEVRSDTGEPLQSIAVLRDLHERSAGIELQLDLSATPRHQDSAPFGEIIVDYPLAAAIDDGIVKRPVLGELRGAAEVASDDASVRYRQQLGAGVAKWREARNALAPAGKKPLLFVMAENTTAADQITAHLETLPDLAGRVLTIHVNMGGANSGEIRKDDLELARAAAHTVDSDDNPYCAIVSVLMLREGWDVRNVCVVVPLRPYTATSKILPEQTLGRGLRRMTPPGSGVDERVVVIEHEAFRSLWEDFAEREGVEVEISDATELLPAPEVIAVDPERLAFDIEVPDIPRRLTRSPAAVAGLDADEIEALDHDVPTDVPDEQIEYVGRDLRTGVVVDEGRIPLPSADQPGPVLAWFVNELQRRTRLTGQFAVLAPVVEQYLERRTFRESVSLSDPTVLHALVARPAIQEAVLHALRSAVDRVALEEPARVAVAEAKSRPLSATRPFLWSGLTARAERSVLNLQPCDSGLEVRLAEWLDRCADVAAFSRLARPMRISMEYRSPEGGLAFYYPDFVVRDDDGVHHLVEAKGLVDPTVASKDVRAAQWCLDATMVSGVPWSYVRIDDDLFTRVAPTTASFSELYEAVLAVRRARRLASLAPRSSPTREQVLASMAAASRATEDDPPDVDAELDRARER